MDAFDVFALGAGLAAAGVCATWAVAVLEAARRPRVLCLMYHRVAPRSAWEATTGTERVFTLPEDAFEAQLRALGADGFTFVGADEVAAHARGERTLPDRSLLLTVDDGCASGVRTILPLLQRHGARATFFVTTDPASPVFSLGGAAERRMTDDELRQLARAGQSIGSHAVSHRPLSALSDDEIRVELAESRRVLESVVGAPVRHFAVPANFYDERVLRIAREVGYESVFCSRPGTVRPGSGAFGIPRLNVEGAVGLSAFQQAVSPAGIAARRLVLAVRQLPKRAVGPRRWSALRRILLGGPLARWLSPSRMILAAGVGAGAGLLLLLAWLVRRAA